MKNFKKECKAVRALLIIIIGALHALSGIPSQVYCSKCPKITLKRLQTSKLSQSGGHAPKLPRRLWPMVTALHYLSALPDQKSWLRHWRSLVRLLINRCVICRRFEGNSFTAPPLPSFRVKEVPPFGYTAVDFTGPSISRREGTQVAKKFGSTCLHVVLFVRFIWSLC